MLLSASIKFCSWLEFFKEKVLHMSLILSSSSKAKLLLSPLLGIPLNEIIGFFTIEPISLIIIVISKKPLKDKFFLSFIDWDSSPKLIFPSTKIFPQRRKNVAV